MGRLWIVRLLVCAPFLAASTAWSADVHGRSSTQFLWFNNFFDGNKQAEFAEYLNMSITNIDKAGKFSIEGYGRVSQDVRNGEGLSGRLYYLYGDYRGLYDKVDIRVGRQWVNYAAGTALIDGGRIDLRNIGPIEFSAMGGRNVVFSLNSESGHEGDYAYGLAAHLAGFKNTNAELSWFRKLDEGDVARDVIGGTFEQYLFKNIKLYANARFDLASEVFNEVLAGVKYYPTADLILTGEWFQSYPTFDTTSIYSVFAVDRYQEGVLRADYSINEYISVSGGYNRQEYSEGASADVYEIGTSIKPNKKLTINLSYDKRNGYGGNLNGGTAEIFYYPVNSLELAGGIQYDVIKRDSLTNEDYARKYWFGGKYRINNRMSTTVRVEDNVNINFSSDWQGRVVFNYDF
ncbi:hypothetical protein [Geobacter sp. SVR]|uniref:hypothetical protein n=1 Tax=Geobacter sp. SVR TaxID=2495594 RepID=UPI00143F0310|nr:hypothetical protein [Geobacter sp. SVR]BCS55905.1 hypothetical protein GSVR_42130 [Geobacter sp. SVR]GCF84668.1 hypothetical protein GSbR_12680 [Geobacter sp. SVR]